ncbi:MAG: C40 family peptidase [Spirochaetia bacterium]
MKRYQKNRLLFIILLGFLSVQLYGQEYLISSQNSLESREEFIDAAEVYLGTPYVFGGADTAGVDCSGLVYGAARDAFGVQLPRGVTDLWNSIPHISRNQLLPGDLVFFDTVSTLSHVGIYVGNDDVMHAASAGPRVGVIISSLNEPYYAQRIHGFGRILPPAAGGVSDEQIARTEVNREQSATPLWNTFSSIANWVFLHEPGNNFYLQFDFPVEINTITGFDFIRNPVSELGVQAAFDFGLWTRTDVQFSSRYLGSDLSNSAISQELSVGVHGDYLIGAGFLWDWHRTIDNAGAVFPESALLLHFGKIDQRRGDPWMLLTAQYRLPLITSQFVFPHHFNIGLDFQIRPLELLSLHTGFSSRTFQGAVCADREACADSLYYQFSLYAGAAVYYPGPFGWGITYTHNYSDEMSTETQWFSRGEFELYIRYIF